MAFGILQRYVMGEVLRAFVMALLTMTIVFVLFMVMAEAAKLGLSPQDIMTLVPFVIPGTLPYTVPVSMLFAATVVYGRLASDNEIIAVKTAGLGALTVLWPAFLLGGALSATLMVLSQSAIPRATHQAKLAIFKNFEDAFYKLLKIEREMANPDWPFLIKVQDVDVESRTMYQAIFKHRAKKGAGHGTFDMTVTAKTARITFDMDAGLARVYLEGANIAGGAKGEDSILIDGKMIEMPVPDRSNKAYEVRVQERTSSELAREQAGFRRKMARERKRQAMAAALFIGSGLFDRVPWDQVKSACVDYAYWKQKVENFETERQLRVAQSMGSLMFVLLGAPVGILFARRDFLSAFISCFMPIILIYYPLMLLGVNLGKEGVVPPVLALWTGNVLLLMLFVFAIRPVHRH